ncbi:hypothetical protein CTI12_AA606610 [Artemisia annua]|uniref:Uncharacterized protein n=1 Tax=Artemisia annua TaxID=35608 RepID=A0A2U1KG43_ARTAN|nr:hypothetical protein CTI12_AA606610 [Artemisia annua]
MLKNPHSLIKMTLEVVYPAVIQVEAKRLIQKVSPKKSDLLDMLLPHIQRKALANDLSVTPWMRTLGNAGLGALQFVQVVNVVYC